MKRRPLGWWDDAAPARTHTRRSANQRTKILAIVAQLQAHPQHRIISEVSHRVLNLASAQSEMGQEAFAKDLEKRLTKALHLIGEGDWPREFFPVPALTVSASADALTTNPQPAADAAAFNQKAK